MIHFEDNKLNFILNLKGCKLSILPVTNTYTYKPIPENQRIHNHNTFNFYSNYIGF